MWAELLMAAALATGECPPTADGSVPPSSGPDWVIKPSPDDVWWAYPPKARAAEKPGRATVYCELSAEGVAENCKIVSEEPQGYDFGEAAVSLTTRMRFRPLMRCGKAERGEVRIPIAFALPDQILADAELDPDDPRLPAARRLAKALHVPAFVEQGLEERSRMAIFQGRDPSADERKAIYQAFAETKSVLQEKFIESVVQTLAKTLSPAEIEQAIVFYETPTGAKLGWGGEVLRQVFAAAGAIKPNPFEHMQQRFCELSPKSCVESPP